MFRDVNDHNVYLKPGDLYVSNKPIRITTVLGSCVSICLYDTVLKTGGMNHFMLPYKRPKDEQIPKYGDVAIHSLIKKMEEMGSSRKSMVAKIIGGADNTGGIKGYFCIGESNHSAAVDILEEYRIKIIRKNIGGNKGRKVIFFPQTGQVYMKFLEYREAEKFQQLEKVIRQAK